MFCTCPSFSDTLHCISTKCAARGGGWHLQTGERMLNGGTVCRTVHVCYPASLHLVAQITGAVVNLNVAQVCDKLIGHAALCVSNET